MKTQSFSASLALPLLALAGDQQPLGHPLNFVDRMFRESDDTPGPQPEKLLSMLEADKLCGNISTVTLEAPGKGLLTFYAGRRHLSTTTTPNYTGRYTLRYSSNTKPPRNAFSVDDRCLVTIPFEDKVNSIGNTPCTPFLFKKIESSGSSRSIGGDSMDTKMPTKVVQPMTKYKNGELDELIAMSPDQIHALGWPENLGNFIQALPLSIVAAAASQAQSLPPDVNKGYIVNIIAWAGAIISTTCVIMRIYSRTFIIQRVGWDDAIVVFAALLTITARALVSVIIAHGVGRHIQYVSSEDTFIIAYYTPILCALGLPAYCLPKLAIVIFISKLLGAAVGRGIWFLYGIIAVLFVTTALSIVILFIECNPPHAILRPFAPARCIPIRVYDIVSMLTCAWSAFADLVLAVYPATLLWRLQMKLSRKVPLMLIMSLGIFAMIAAVTKLSKLHELNSPDMTYDVVWLYILFTVETDLVIIASCAPAFPKLWSRAFGNDYWAV
ncbi:hypothetical protein F4808DRAFT_472820 [Astrocystis sublimbata]|nr:hypothetical protein F4808DRAFT_472820 [Astrocystis sublimbata]